MTPYPANDGIWEIVIELPSGDGIELFETAITDFVTGHAIFEVENTPRWRLTGYTDTAPDAGAIEAGIADAALAAGIDTPRVQIAPVVQKDWVAESEKSLPALHVGPYFVFGSHIRETPPPDSIAIRIDAGLAFGTGNHETTQGCLLALERAFAERLPANPIDIGTGSGILAIAIAKRCDVHVSASDIDPIAVDVARENAVINGVGDRVSCFVADGVDGHEIGTSAPYDLVVANIVANPLIALAVGIGRNLAEDGFVILSGILNEQSSGVTEAYAAEGLILTDKIELGNWTTLILQRPD
jgi:ribosomal protein L11 methyltransferase